MMRSRRTTVGAGLGLPLVLAVLSGCPGGSNVAPPIATPPASAEAKVTLPKNGAWTVRPLLDDPRLATARNLEHAKDWAGAAKALRDARPSELTLEDACAWDFLEGRLDLLANALPEAVAAFTRAEAPGCPLAGYAKVRAAQALARAGHADEAIARARAVPEDIGPAVGDEVKLVISESLATKGDRAGALPLWRSWLAANPHGSRWVDTSVRLANALLDGVDGPPEAHAKEAYDAVTRVVTEAPKLADSSGATQARLRAVAVLRTNEPSFSEALGESERVRQAQAWLDANEPTRAFELASAIVKASPASCKAALTRANAGSKKVPKTDVWAETVAACEKDTDLVTALYSGAKARTGKDPRLAIEWFGKVEQLFPSHRLADDARFRAALLLTDTSEERAEQMLRTLPDDYPAGDMRTEALFRLALSRMKKGRAEDWELAKAALDRIVELTPEDRHWATSGRAEYFRARAAAATGDADGARTRYEHIVERHPLSFYMVLAYGRLAMMDATHARKVFDAATVRDREQKAPTQDKPPAVLESAGFVRAVKLLEVSDVEAAKREFTSSGAVADGAAPEVLWTIGALYNQAGWPEFGHAFSRSRLTDHLEHYPEGRWRDSWQVAYPRAFEPLVVAACEKYRLPQAIAWGIMREESSFVADAKSPANAYGLMQLIVPTAKGLAAGTGFGTDEASLKRPEVSIEFGTKFLAALRAQHGNNALAIGAYNSGSGSIGRWMNNRTSDELDLFVESVPYDETRNYIKRVLSSVAAYGYLYDRKTFDEVLGLSLRLGK